MTPRRSVRADAQRRLRAASKIVPFTFGPHPDPPPQAGEGTEGASAGQRVVWLPPWPTKLQQTDASLTGRVRALYEDGVMPVADIARLAGVAERTLYRYVARGGWVRRDPQRGLAAAAANRGRQRTERPPQPRGAGGRFVPPAEQGRPHARGLKALDPAGASHAATACDAASDAAHAAFARALALHDAYMQAQIFALVVRAMRDLAAMLDEPEQTAREPAKARHKTRHKTRHRPRRKVWTGGLVSFPT